MADAIKTQTILFVGAAEGDGLSLDKIFLDSSWKLHGAGNCREALCETRQMSAEDLKFKEVLI